MKDFKIFCSHTHLFTKLKEQEDVDFDVLPTKGKFDTWEMGKGKRKSLINEPNLSFIVCCVRNSAFKLINIP